VKAPCKALPARRRCPRRRAPAAVLIAIGIFLAVAPALPALGSGERTGPRRLEIFSWWTAGGEAEGLAALFDIYRAKFPTVFMINATVAGGAGSNAKTELATRMQGGNPPDSFQVHAGHELIDTWVVAGKMEPITFIFRANGWLEKFPRSLIDIISWKGEIYSVPLDIHRSNVLWYNTALFAAHHLSPPRTLPEFLDVCSALAAKGITPIALGDNGIWTSLHLLESVLVGTLGPEKYKGLWTGATRWDSPEIRNALATFARLLRYVNSDHAALSWDGAVQYVIDGKCAMTIMGDWAEGYFKARGQTPNKEFGWVPSPGTAGTFVMLSDSFGLPRGAPDREAAVQWLTLAASREGQDAFNPKKGSIPSRTDCDRSLYDQYQQSAMDSYRSEIIVPSVTHGAAAAEGWLAAIQDVMSTFVCDLNTDKAAVDLAAISAKYVKASR